MTHRNDVQQSGARRVAKALKSVFLDVDRAQRAWYDDFVRLAARGDRIRH